MSRIINKRCPNIRANIVCPIRINIYPEFERAYIIYPYINHINHTEIPTKHKFNHATTLLNIVRELHRCNINHNDIKPDNILITKNNLYIIDFGFAKQYESFAR